MPDEKHNDGVLEIFQINKVPQYFAFKATPVRGKMEPVYEHEFFYMSLISEQDTTVGMRFVVP